jgi:hypothetical protein
MLNTLKFRFSWDCQKIWNLVSYFSVSLSKNWKGVFCFTKTNTNTSLPLPPTPLPVSIFNIDFFKNHQKLRFLSNHYFFKSIFKLCFFKKSMFLQKLIQMFPTELFKKFPLKLLQKFPLKLLKKFPLKLLQKFPLKLVEILRPDLMRWMTQKIKRSRLQKRSFYWL